MVSEKSIVQQLSQEGYRITRPRRAVIRALLEDEDLLSELGFVRRIHAEEGCHSYATANHGHHHHLVCRSCGAAIEFQGCDLSPFLARLSQQTGYTIEDHLLELVGVCSTCQ